MTQPGTNSKGLRNFLRLLHELQKIDPEFPLQYAVCLAEIAMNEGCSLTALSEKTGLAMSTTSRIVGALSKNRQKGAPYNLVRAQISATEKRRRELYLSARGKAVISGIAEIMA